MPEKTNFAKSTGRPSLCVYDMETTYLTARGVWRLGEQVLRHDQLIPGKDKYRIMVLSYSINFGPVQTLIWNRKQNNSKKILQDFDQVIDGIDVIIGKNNGKFDDKMLNTLRMEYGLPGRPDMIKRSDDVERQLRKFFYLPSYSLDYFTKVYLDGQGKIDMRLDNWIRMQEPKTEKEYQQALKEMIAYNHKDITDTNASFSKIFDHVQFKNSNANIYSNGRVVCRRPDCGSSNLTKDGTRYLNGVLKQRMYCKEHKGYAGVFTLRKDGTLGRGE